MNEVYVKDLIKLCDAELVCGKENEVLDNFTKDTREVEKGCTFVGFEGENVDGNLLYEEALKNGASVCILTKESVKDKIDARALKRKYEDRAVILVENTIKAIQQLASYKRGLYNIPVVGVTGSVGKTSTKDIIASVMAKKYNVLKTLGNYNSQIGLPFTVLRLKDNDAMVAEMGMNGLGEISKLAQIARPSIAVITNVGTAHIGVLGSRENILKAKLEILDGLEPNGTLVINNDNDMLHEWYEHANVERTTEKELSIPSTEENIEKVENGQETDRAQNYNIVTFGINNKSDFMPYDITFSDNGSRYKINVDGKEYNVNISVGGEHFVLNSLCAIAVGRLLNIDMEDILAGIANFELTKRRMQVEKNKQGVTIINDAYNANLDSMKAAIDYLGKINAKNKISVLGDMLELGEFSKELHERVGEEVQKNKIDILITVGDCARDIARKAQECGMDKEKIYICNSNDEAIELLKKLAKEGDAVLLKASNGMNFEQIFQKIV